MEEGTMLNTKSSELVPEGEGDGIPTPSKTWLDDQRGTMKMEEEIPLNMNSISADRGTPLKETWSDKKERAEEEGMETDPSPSEM
jgi:hypothetical protein